MQPITANHSKSQPITINHTPQDFSQAATSAVIESESLAVSHSVVQPLDDLESMDAPSLRGLVSVLHEALEARQQQLLQHADALSTSKHVAHQLAVRSGAVCPDMIDGQCCWLLLT